MATKYLRNVVFQFGCLSFIDFKEILILRSFKLFVSIYSSVFLSDFGADLTFVKNVLNRRWRILGIKVAEIFLGIRDHDLLVIVSKVNTIRYLTRCTNLITITKFWRFIRGAQKARPRESPRSKPMLNRS